MSLKSSGSKRGVEGRAVTRHPASAQSSWLVPVCPRPWSLHAETPAAQSCGFSALPTSDHSATPPHLESPPLCFLVEGLLQPLLASGTALIFQALTDGWKSRVQTGARCKGGKGRRESSLGWQKRPSFFLGLPGFCSKTRAQSSTIRSSRNGQAARGREVQSPSRAVRTLSADGGWRQEKNDPIWYPVWCSGG